MITSDLFTNNSSALFENTGPVTHRIGLTVTDPNHPMVSKRGETIQKTVRVKGDDREKAINGAIAHYRRKGYKVHDHHYIGTVDQGVAEGMPLGKVLSFPDLVGQVKHILDAKHGDIGWKMSKRDDDVFLFSAMNDYNVRSMLVVAKDSDGWVSATNGMVDPHGEVEMYDKQELPMTLASASEIADEAISTYHDIDLSDYAGEDEQDVAEGQLELNTPDPVVVVQDQQGKILDKVNLSVAAQKYKLGQPQNIKNQLAHQNYTKIGSYTIVSPMSGQPQDQTTTGQKTTFATPGVVENMPHGQDINDPLAPSYGGNRNRSVKQNIQARLGHDERGDARERAGQPRSTHARHKPQLPESSMDDNAIWSQYGQYNAQDLMQEFPNLSPKDAQTIVNYAEYGWSSSNPQKFRNEVVQRVKMAMGQQGVAEGKKPDSYHIVNKDGKPATLASYADKASAVKDRDTKHPGAEVRQLGPRGKVKNVSEVSLGDYRKKATVNKAVAQANKFFDRDDAAKVAAADKTIAKREKGLARADARVKPYTPPAQDAEKYQRDLTAKYPNIDELVADAEKRRDPQYDYAEGDAYYRGREAEQNYQKLKQIQRVIQGLNESLNRSHLP